jgi:hypothetical protein
MADKPSTQQDPENLSPRHPDTPTPSFEHGHAEYTDAELLEQVRGNAQALLLATVTFLDERGIPPAEWAAAIGETFARGWGDVRPWDAGEFLDAMLTNLRAFGAAVVSVELGVDRAVAATTGFPDPDLCALLGVAPARADQFHDAATAIAAPRGLRWAWRRADDGVTHHLVERITE